jgi:hypothetical protein
MNYQELKTMWKTQPVHSGPLSLDQIKRDAEAFHRTVVRQNRAGAAGAIAIMLIFGAYAWFLPDVVIRIGSGLVAAGALVALLTHRKLASTRGLPQDGVASTYVDYFRAELIRQRDGLRSVWLWGVAPFLPGTSLIVYGMGHQHGGVLPWQIPAMFVVPTLVAIWMHFAHARKIQHKIDALDAVET